MDITVKLQEPFSYALWPVIVLGIIILGIIAALLVMKFYNPEKKRVHGKTEKTGERQKVVDKNAVKAEYCSRLNALKRDFENNKLSIRRAYQRLSALVRGFVFEMTGVKVHNYTLREIKTVNMPELETLITEFYSPEFAVKSEGDVYAAIEKTRRVIEEWK